MAAETAKLSLRFSTLRGLLELKNLFSIISRTECTKIAHRRSLAIFAADSGIAGNSAVGIKFVPFNRRENRRSLAIFFAKEIASWGLKNRAILRGSGENRRRNRRESRDFGALSESRSV